MSERSKYEEYLICQQRGHDGDGMVYTSSPPKSRCKRCGAFFWTERIEREFGAPEPPTPKRRCRNVNVN